MAEETGEMSVNLEPFLRLRLSTGEIVECLIDTGFTGDLTLPPNLAKNLSLKVIGTEEICMADGRKINAELVKVWIEWLGTMRAVEAIVIDNCLVGSGLLNGTRLIVDYMRYTVTVSDVLVD